MSGIVHGSSLIGGSWLPSRGKGYERFNPADRGDVLGPYFPADPKDVERAIAAAAEAQRAWVSKTAPARGEILMRAAGVVRDRVDEIAGVLTREEGKTLWEATAEIQAGAAILEFLGAGGLWGGRGEVVDSLRPTTLLYTRRKPLGVVAAITPWNFPFSNPAIKLGTALVAGNAVVWKPATWTPGTALALTECFMVAGIPAGVLSTLLGSGSTVGEQLASDPRVRAVTFTGSTEVGLSLAVRLAERTARAQLELGGKNAIVVLDDADLAAAARATALAAFLSAGQKCTAASRVIVLPGIRGPFLEALVEQTRALTVGPPTDPGTKVGPVVHEGQLERHLAAIEEATTTGARVVEGGHRLGDDLAIGNYLAPTILDRVAPDAPIAQEEIFGPILAVIDAADYADALRITNGTRYGLTASVYTRDLPRAIDFAERCEVGVVKVNEPPTGLDPHVPTGGWKDSGGGARELGPRALDFFTEEKTVYLNHLGVPPA